MRRLWGPALRGCVLVSAMRDTGCAQHAHLRRSKVHPQPNLELGRARLARQGLPTSTSHLHATCSAEVTTGPSATLPARRGTNHADGVETAADAGTTTSIDRSHGRPRLCRWQRCGPGSCGAHRGIWQRAGASKQRIRRRPSGRAWWSRPERTGGSEHSDQVTSADAARVIGCNGDDVAAGNRHAA